MRKESVAYTVITTETGIVDASQHLNKQLYDEPPPSAPNNETLLHLIMDRVESDPDAEGVSGAITDTNTLTITYDLKYECDASILEDDMTHLTQYGLTITSVTFTSEGINRCIYRNGKELSEFLSMEDILPIMEQNMASTEHDWEQALNPTTTTTELDFLAEHSNRSIRHAVAEHPNTSPGTLNVMSHSPDFRVRYNVAKNTATPTDTLLQLAADSQKSVRTAVINNPNTPPKIAAIAALH